MPDERKHIKHQKNKNKKIKVTDKYYERYYASFSKVKK